MVPRLQERYRNEVVPKLREEFGYANVNQVPGLVKTVVNIGLGEATPDNRVSVDAVYCLGLCARGPAMMVNGNLVADADALAEQVLEGLE